ncbi:MAG: GNAT family N-acetyltransferase [Ahniella sp.]|nr:GNAT family N-acetyltransferase [Ahniella sp.]
MNDRVVVGPETGRLRFVEFSPEYAPDLFRLMTDPDWLRNIGDRGVRSIDDARTQIEQKYRPQMREQGFGFFVLVDKASDSMAGMCGLIRRDGLDGIDLGYALLPEFRGRGLAVEAASAVLAWGQKQLGLSRVLAIVNPDNAASIAVLERVGMRFERLIRLPGEQKDLALHAWVAGSP